MNKIKAVLVVLALLAICAVGLTIYTFLLGVLPPGHSVVDVEIEIDHTIAVPTSGVCQHTGIPVEASKVKEPNTAVLPWSETLEMLYDLTGDIPPYWLQFTQAKEQWGLTLSYGRDPRNPLLLNVFLARLVHVEGGYYIRDAQLLDSLEVDLTNPVPIRIDVYSSEGSIQSFEFNLQACR